MSSSLWILVFLSLFLIQLKCTLLKHWNILGLSDREVFLFSRLPCNHVFSDSGTRVAGFLSLSALQSCILMLPVLCSCLLRQQCGIGVHSLSPPPSEDPCSETLCEGIIAAAACRSPNPLSHLLCKSNRKLPLYRSLGNRVWYPVLQPIFVVNKTRNHFWLSLLGWPVSHDRRYFYAEDNIFFATIHRPYGIEEILI